MSRTAAGLALSGYVVVLAAITLGSSPQSILLRLTDEIHRNTGLVELSRADVERTANVLLFVPAGLLLCYVLPRTSRWLVWLICVAVSVSVEAVQLPQAGRDATPVDVATNSAGAAIGVLLHAVLPALAEPERGLSHRQT